MKKLSSLALLCAVILAAFGAATTTRAAQAPGGAITFYFFGDKTEEEAYTTLVKAYNVKYPAVKVNITPLPDGDAYLKKLTTDFVGGAPPDVFLINYREYVAYARRGQIEPVGPYLDKSTVVKKADLWEPSVRAFTRDGVLQCMAQNTSSLAVYYNKDLFKKANVPLPANDWTWDDFLKAAKALTNDATDPKLKQYGAGVQVQFYRLMPFIWANGGEIVDNQEKPTRLLIDSPEAKAALQWFADLQVKHKVVPSETDGKAQADQARFLAGTMGMFLQSRRFTTTARTIKDFDWDVAPLPRGKQATTVLHADGYCLSQAGKNKDTAWSFAEFAASVDGQTILTKTGRLVPVNKAVAQSPVFLDPATKPSNAQLFLDVIPTIRLSPNNDTWADVEAELNRMVGFVFYGEKTVDQAVADAIKNTEPFFKQ